MSGGPHLRVVRGNPDDVELAVVTAVVAGLAASGGSAPERSRPSTWAAPSRLVRRPLPHGPGAWRASGLPG
ncbi:acyl-CoA carboxylase subunit epsilon [Saccharothrix longispora]|uniref:acyl-CoA carboxylase subunit epsilon n=1 Tax=Saccharothrix longispora TaxID=33920 RepID=UPI0028FD963C|nr:acyl-CoA carboxylase subunit epsilon [Saccharothrix longispora]MDU0292192.1 acyl-CoA carboxylase subunit epsilon [Saccharothrix longispora]